jgi:hypothetical protein
MRRISSEAFRIAWAAVKRSYVKVGDRWVERVRRSDAVKGMLQS